MQSQVLNYVLLVLYRIAYLSIAGATRLHRFAPPVNVFESDLISTSPYTKHAPPFLLAYAKPFTMPLFNSHDLAERDAMINASMHVQIGQLANELEVPRRAPRREAVQLFGSAIVNVPAHRVRIDQAPLNLTESLVATVGSPNEYSRAQVIHQDQPQGYQSRFHEDFETSASQEEIRRLSYREIPDSDEYDSLSSNGWYPAGEEPWDSEFDSEPEEEAQDIVGAPRRIQYVSQIYFHLYNYDYRDFQNFYHLPWLQSCSADISFNCYPLCWLYLRISGNCRIIPNTFFGYKYHVLPSVLTSSISNISLSSNDSYIYIYIYHTSAPDGTYVY